MIELDMALRAADCLRQNLVALDRLKNHLCIHEGTVKRSLEHINRNDNVDLVAHKAVLDVRDLIRTFAVNAFDYQVTIEQRALELLAFEQILQTDFDLLEMSF
jgi:hypothetical protein